MLNERSLTKAEEKRKEEIVKDLKSNKREFVKRYGKDAESVMYGTAVKRAKKQVKEMNENRIKEAVKAALMKKEGVKEERMEYFEPEDYEAMRDLQDASAMMDAIEDLYKKAKALGYGPDVKKLVADLDEELKNPKKADLNKDGELSSYEEKRGEAIEKAIAKKGVKETKGLRKITGPTGDSEVQALTPQEEEELKRVGAKVTPMEGKYDPDQAQLDDEDEIFMSYDDEGRPLEEKNMSKYKVGDKIKWSSPKGEVEDEIAGIDGIYLKLKSGGSIPYQSVVSEDLDLGHEDDEPHMIKGELYRIGKYAMELYQMVDQFEGMGEVDFPAWWQAMITDAASKMSKAKHYLDFELKEPEIDAMVGVASAEDVIDEEKISGEEKLAAAIQKALNKNKSADDQNNIKQARKAMNDGNMEAAKKILKPYLEEGLPKGYWSKKIPGGKMEESNVNESFLAVSTKGAIKDENLDSFISKMEAAGYKLAKILGPEDNLYKDHPIIDHTWTYGLPKFNDIIGPMKDGDRFRYEDQETYNRMSLEESYEKLVKKIKGQGKSEKAAKAIAGAVAAYKAKGGGKGPTAKQKK
jgi:hypothetical protein